MTLKCESKDIKCHKVVLVSFSAYFRAMFSCDLLENKTNIVQMPHTTHESLLHLINYAYSGSIGLTMHNVDSILSLASLLQVNELVEACSEFLQARIDLTNCLSIFYLSSMYHCINLKVKTKEFIEKYFNLIIEDEDFLQIDFEYLQEILASDELNIDKEETVFQFIIKWVNYYYESRVHLLEDLLWVTRLGLISDLPAFIMQNEAEIKRVHADFYEKLVQVIPKKQQNQLSKLKRAGMTKAEHCFIILGGNYEIEDYENYVNCCNPETLEKCHISRNFQDRLRNSKGYFHIENPGVCVTESNRIFIAGGKYVFHEYKSLNKLAKYEEEYSDDCKSLKFNLNKIFKIFCRQRRRFSKQRNLRIRQCVRYVEPPSEHAVSQNEFLNVRHGRSHLLVRRYHYR